MYRIEIRTICSDGWKSGWSNWSKKYKTIRRALQALKCYNNQIYMRTTSYGPNGEKTYYHYEYRIINFY